MLEEQLSQPITVNPHRVLGATLKDRFGNGIDEDRIFKIVQVRKTPFH